MEHIETLDAAHELGKIDTLTFFKALDKSKLQKKVITDKKGKRTTKWVSAEKSKQKQSGEESNEKQVKKTKKTSQDFSDEELQNFSSQVSDSKLKEVAQGTDERLRIFAKRELDNRKTEHSEETVESSEKNKEQTTQLPKNIFEKVKKREVGKGGEIKLNESELKILFEKGKVMIISPGLNPNDENEVKSGQEAFEKRKDEMEKEFVQNGFTFIKANGKYEGFEEGSYVVLVPEIEKKEAMKLGEKYNQDSIVYIENGKNNLIYTVGDKKGKQYGGEGFKKEDSSKEDNFSQVFLKNGKKMKFNLSFDFSNLKEIEKSIQIIKKANEDGKIDEKVLFASYRNAIKKIIDSKEDKPFNYEYYLNKYSLNRSRDSMPQIDEDDLDSFILHFANSENKVSKVKMRLFELKPSQNEINIDKVKEKIEEFSENYCSRKYVISKDNYIVDGHHDWAHGLQIDPFCEVDCYKINLPIIELLRRANLLKMTTKRDLNTFNSLKTNTVNKGLNNDDFLIQLFTNEEV